MRLTRALVLLALVPLLLGATVDIWTATFPAALERYVQRLQSGEVRYKGVKGGVALETPNKVTFTEFTGDASQYEDAIASAEAGEGLDLCTNAATALCDWGGHGGPPTQVLTWKGPGGLYCGAHCATLDTYAYVVLIR